MSRTGITWVLMSLLAGLVLVSCAKSEPTPRPPVPEDSAIRVSGAVAQEYGWTTQDLKAMKTSQVEATDRDGKTKTYTGVSINALLDYAQPKAEATAIQLKADYGYVVDLPLDKVKACEKCIVAFNEAGDQLLSVMPGFDTTAQIEGLVRILVK